MATNRFIFYLIGSFFLVLLICAGGCAEFNIFEAPAEVLKHPLGTDPLRVGMTKDEVVSIWGKPDQINMLKSGDEWATPREEWVYIGRYSKIPIDRSYFFKTKYLIFDGNNLVCFGNESQCQDVDTKKSGTEEER